jgi:hypothetical protein
MADKFKKGGRVSTDWKGTKTKETWGKNDLSEMYDNNLDLVADVSDYYKDLETDISKSYSDEMKNDMFEALKNGKIVISNSSLKFEKGGQANIDKNSILNRDTDLLGDEKQSYMYLLPIPYKELKKGKKIKLIIDGDFRLVKQYDYYQIIDGMYGQILAQQNTPEEVFKKANRLLSEHKIKDFEQVKKIAKQLLINAYKVIVKDAIENGYYVEDIKDGRMSVSDAIAIIREVGLKVPNNVKNARPKLTPDQIAASKRKVKFHPDSNPETVEKVKNALQQTTNNKQQTTNIKTDEIAKWSKAKDWGNIEKETILLPRIVADNVISNTSFDLSNEAEFNKFIDYLVGRAETLYKENADFKKKLKASGEKGRNYLYTMMEHWTEGYMKAVGSGQLAVGKPATSNQQPVTESILNQDTDLKGGKKLGYQLTLNQFLKADFIYMYFGTVGYRTLNKTFKFEFNEDNGRHYNAFTSKVYKEIIYGRKKDDFKSIVLHAIEETNYQKDISEGRMTANDAITIIESAGLKAPEDIIDIAVGFKKVTRKLTINEINENKSKFPEIIQRAINKTITDIGQLTDEEKKVLENYVKSGVLDKAKGGGFPKLKTVYAIKGFDFNKDREYQLSHLEDINTDFTLSDYQAALDGFLILAEDAKGKEKDDYQAAIDGILIMIEGFGEQTEAPKDGKKAVIRKEGEKTNIYKLGDEWSPDFDYKGMLQMGAKSDISWGEDKLQSLADSFTDVNYHTESRPLYDAIDLLKEGQKMEAENKIKEFHVAVQDSLENIDFDDEEFEHGGSLQSSISDEEYYLCVNHFAYFCFNYPPNFIEAWDEGWQKHFQPKFDAIYQRNGSDAVMLYFWTELSNGNRQIFANWIKANYHEGTSLADVSNETYCRCVNHFVFFCFNFPPNFLDAWEGNIKQHLDEKFRSIYIHHTVSSVMLWFYIELSSGNRRILADWIKYNYSGQMLEHGGAVQSEVIDSQSAINTEEPELFLINSKVPESVLESWLNHYKTWCTVNNVAPEYEAPEDVANNPVKILDLATVAYKYLSDYNAHIEGWNEYVGFKPEFLQKHTQQLNTDFEKFGKGGEMQRTGTFTGRWIKVPAFENEVKIGKISGYHGTGEPVYDLLGDVDGHLKKVGELGNNFIKKYLKNSKFGLGGAISFQLDASKAKMMGAITDEEYKLVSKGKVLFTGKNNMTKSQMRDYERYDDVVDKINTALNTSYEDGGEVHHNYNYTYEDAPQTFRQGDFWIYKNTDGNNGSFKRHPDGGVPFYVTNREGIVMYKAENWRDASEWIDQRYFEDGGELSKGETIMYEKNDKKATFRMVYGDYIYYGYIDGEKELQTQDSDVILQFIVMPYEWFTKYYEADLTQQNKQTLAMLTETAHGSGDNYISQKSRKEAFQKYLKKQFEIIVKQSPEKYPNLAKSEQYFRHLSELLVAKIFMIDDTDIEPYFSLEEVPAEIWYQWIDAVAKIEFVTEYETFTHNKRDKYPKIFNARNNTVYPPKDFMENGGTLNSKKYYDLADELLTSEFDNFDNNPTDYIKSMAWNVNAYSKIDDYKYELTQSADDIQKLANILDKQNGDIEADAVQDYISNLVAQKIIDAYDETRDDPIGEEPEMEFDDENEPDQPDTDNDDFIESNGFEDIASHAGKYIDKFDDMDDALAAIIEKRKKDNYFPTIWFVSDHGNSWPIDEEGNEIKFEKGGELNDYDQNEQQAIATLILRTTNEISPASAKDYARRFNFLKSEHGDNYQEAANEIIGYFNEEKNEHLNNPTLVKVAEAINSGKLKILRGGEKMYGKLKLSITELVWARNFEDGFEIYVYENGSHIGTIEKTASTNWKAVVKDEYEKGGELERRHLEHFRNTHGNELDFAKFIDRVRRDVSDYMRYKHEIDAFIDLDNKVIDIGILNETEKPIPAAKKKQLKAEWEAKYSQYIKKFEKGGEVKDSDRKKWEEIVKQHGWKYLDMPNAEIYYDTAKKIITDAKSVNELFLWDFVNFFISRKDVNRKFKGKLDLVKKELIAKLRKSKHYYDTSDEFEDGGEIPDREAYNKALSDYNKYGELLDDAKEVNNNEDTEKYRKLMNDAEIIMHRYEREYEKGGELKWKGIKSNEFNHVAKIPIGKHKWFIDLSENPNTNKPKITVYEEYGNSQDVIYYGKDSQQKLGFDFEVPKKIRDKILEIYESLDEEHQKTVQAVDNRIISLYESFFIDGREHMRIIAQGVYSKEREQKMIERAKKGMFEKFDDGRYDYKQEVFVHPKNTTKPYLDKYKVF